MALHVLEQLLHVDRGAAGIGDWIVRARSCVERANNAREGEQKHAFISAPQVQTRAGERLGWGTDGKGSGFRA